MMSTRVDGMTKRGAHGHATAKADDRHVARVVVQQQRQVCQELLRQHVAPVRGIHFSIDGQRCRSREPLHGNGRRRAVAIVQERPRLQLRVEIEIFRNVWRVQVSAAREKRPIPGRSDHHGEAGCDCRHGAQTPDDRRQPSGRHDRQRRGHEASGHNVQRSV